jgi:cation diffusion facilitator family transporter
VLIVLAAILILREAYQSYLVPRLVEAPWVGLLLNAAASVINAGWAWVLIRQGRIHRSPALAADGRHLLSDVYSSIGVLGGVGVAALSGIAILDPILAALVALNILWAGWGLMKESLSGLMDEAIPPAMLASIKQTISAHADGAIEAHDLRTRRAGSMTFIDFHLVVAGSTTVSAAHDICDKLETAIRQEIGEALITIHVEPDDKAKHSGIVVL